MITDKEVLLRLKQRYNKILKHKNQLLAYYAGGNTYQYSAADVDSKCRHVRSELHRACFLIIRGYTLDRPYTR